MSPYISFRELDDKGELQYYILQREWPHYVGVIKSKPQESVLVQAPVSGHYLWVAFCGTLRGNMIPAFAEVYKEIESVFTGMAEWYFTERISTSPSKFKKFKIKTFHGSQ